MIGDLAGALEHLALAVRPVSDLKAGRDGRRLRFAEFRAAWIGEIAEREQLEAVTARADLAIDLEAALKLRGVVGAERTVKRPVLARRSVSLLRGSDADAGPGQHGRGRQNQ